MEQETWADSITDEERQQFLFQLRLGVQSIDLSTNSAAFITTNLSMGQFGWNAELSECHVEINLPYVGGGLDVCDIAIAARGANIASSVAITCSDQQGDLTNTYHILNWVSGELQTYEDMGYIVGVALGAAYYEIDEGKAPADDSHDL